MAEKLKFLNDIWTSLSIEEKDVLIQYHLSLKKQDAVDEFTPLFENIQPFQETLISFLSLSDLNSLFLCSKQLNTFKDCLFPIAVKRFQFSSLVQRLIQVTGNGMTVQPRRVFDEKCRYVIMTNGNFGTHICEIDKHTGVILTSDKSVRSSILLPDVQEYFCHTLGVRLKYFNELTKNQKKTIKEILEPQYNNGTKQLKLMKNSQKKRLFASKWDESKKRRKP